MAMFYCVTSLPEETDNMVEVFKTNVEDKDLAEMIIKILSRELPECRINFDLDDCDRILRVEGEKLPVEIIRNKVHKKGVRCEVLL